MQVSRVAVPLAFVGAISFESRASAQNDPTGAPPPEAKAVVSAPAAAADAPKISDSVDGTAATLSAGGLLTTGNSRLLAMSANGAFDTRWDDNGIGASLLGNYGQGAPSGSPVHITTENIQGRLRYDRYVIERLAVFLLNTGRHDRFQGLDFRYNLDPGVKYLFIPQQERVLWAELGYDLQYDVRRNQDRIVLDDSGSAVIDTTTGQPKRLDKMDVDHSLRLFVGHKHAFNKEVTLALGVEYLQSFKDTDRARLNFDAVFAAAVGGGFSVGLGWSGRYDHAPLPAKKDLDTSTTLSLIYAFSDIPDKKEAKSCPCAEPAQAPQAPAFPDPKPADGPPPAKPAMPNDMP